MKTADSIIQNMNNGNYDVALILIDQLQEDTPLTQDFQLCKVQCLYALNRFFEAHEAASKYAEEGNDLQDLTFMRGLICFALGQYESAKKFFGTDPQWSIWQQKTNAMNQIAKGQTSQITFSEPLQETDFSKVKKKWSQTDTSVTVSLMAPNFLICQVKASFHFQAIDVIISENNEKKAISIDLEKPISPRTGVYACYSDRIEFTAEKEKPKEVWTFQEVPKEKDSDITLESILLELDTIPEVTNEMALDGFERSIEKLDYGYSSEDEYEETEQKKQEATNDQE